MQALNLPFPQTKIKWLKDLTIIISRVDLIQTYRCMYPMLNTATAHPSVQVAFIKIDHLLCYIENLDEFCKVEIIQMFWF